MPRSRLFCLFRVNFRGCGPVPSPPGRFACAGEGVVECPGRVACPSGRRCSTRNAVWCHSHPGFKSQRYRHYRPAHWGRAVLLCLGVAPVAEVWAGASSRCPARPRPSKHALSSMSHSVPQCLQSAALRKARNFNDYNSNHEMCAGELHANMCR